MCCSIVATRLILLRHEVHEGFGDAGRRFSAVALCSLPLLIAFFAAAIANTRRPEFHKRLMYLVMVGLMIPALGRIFLVLRALDARACAFFGHDGVVNSDSGAREADGLKGGDPYR